MCPWTFEKTGKRIRNLPIPSCLLLPRTHKITPLSSLSPRHSLSDANSRYHSPRFYGIVPSTGKARTFVINALRLMVFSQFTVTMIKLTLMSQVLGLGGLLKYALARQLLFHLFKATRGDWQYWYVSTIGLGGM